MQKHERKGGKSFENKSQCFNLREKEKKLSQKTSRINRLKTLKVIWKLTETKQNEKGMVENVVTLKLFIKYFVLISIQISFSDTNFPSRLWQIHTQFVANFHFFHSSVWFSISSWDHLNWRKINSFGSIMFVSHLKCLSVNLWTSRQPNVNVSTRCIYSSSIYFNIFRNGLFWIWRVYFSFIIKFDGRTTSKYLFKCTTHDRHLSKKWISMRKQKVAQKTERKKPKWMDRLLVHW